ncbi:hypothetical protein ABZ891_20035 [Streptomyces sp. NPDC047023]|uniref:hypothetical protein n=1 Tax=Streptomyces sp. NPDC047023 TaxID=3155139 RepID=UPI0033CA7DE3
MSAQGVVRVYTSARRHPWVLGKLGDWTVPFGPYTPAQLVVLGGGAFTLIKTYAFWSWAGPVPLLLWLASVWAVRGARIAGQNPFTAVFGMLVLMARHPAGRVGGRIARDRQHSGMRCRFVITPVSGQGVGASPAKGPASALTSASMPGVAAAGSGLSRLLAGAGREV